MLRLGAFEILYTETDTPVIINEAVELGKMYGGEDNAPRFINGVLDALSKAHTKNKKSEDCSKTQDIINDALGKES